MRESGSRGSSVMSESGAAGHDDPAIRHTQGVRRPGAVRQPHLAGAGGRAGGALRGERRGQDDAARDHGRARGNRCRHAGAAGRSHGRVPAAGRHRPRRAHAGRRSALRLPRAAGDPGRDAGDRDPPGGGGGRARAAADPLQRAAGDVSASGRLRPRRARDGRAAGTGVHRRGPRAPHRGILRRMADAHRAGEAAAAPAAIAADGRTDQPPRPGGPQLARGLPRGLPPCRRAGLARPLLSRPRRDLDRRARTAHADDVSGQLQRLSRRARRPPGAPAGTQAAAGRRDRAHAGLHRPLSVPGDEGGAGAEPGEDA